MDELTVGSLFAGVGGFDLGFERAGMRTLWFAEQDPYCRRVLAKHWPGVPCHPDVRALVADTNSRGFSEPRVCSEQQERTEAISTGAGDRYVPVSVPYVDVLCGGFPCQDISLAGKGAGIGGSRSGLWGEFARLIGELRPRYVVVENVPAITSRGLDVVLGDLAARGFDAEWDHLPASAFGAPHRRDRFWLVAYPNGGGEPHGPVDAQAPGDADVAGRGDPEVGDSDAERRDGRSGQLGPRRRGEPSDPGWWLTESDVGRVAYGVPHRVDRLRALGNGLVPQIAEWIGRRIVDWERG